MTLRPMVSFALLAGLMFGLMGCFSSMTSSGSLSSDKLQANLVVGKTNQAEVRQIYGQPTTVRKLKDGSVWTYIFDPSAMNNAASTVGGTVADAAIAHGTASALSASAQSGSMAGALGASIASSHASQLVNTAMAPDTRSKTLTINFDKPGIVKSYSLQ